MSGRLLESEDLTPEAVRQWPCGILGAGCWGLCVETKEEAVCLMLQGGLPWVSGGWPISSLSLVTAGGPARLLSDLPPAPHPCCSGWGAPR